MASVSKKEAEQDLLHVLWTFSSSLQLHESQMFLLQKASQKQGSFVAKHY